MIDNIVSFLQDELGLTMEYVIVIGALLISIRIYCKLVPIIARLIYRE